MANPGQPAPLADEDDDRYVVLPRQVWVDGALAQPEAKDDALAREEPLELRIAGTSVAVVMRTPGHDLELARGFLLSEGIVPDATAVADVRHCTTVDSPEAEDNVLLVRLAEGVDLDLAALRRNLYASSSCGVCGKASIEAALRPSQRCARTLDRARPRVDAEVLYGLPGALETDQPVFARTGGLHAAGLFTAAGERLVVREDVGRHNAVDKVLGWAMAAGVELGDKLLMVSGRVSFEITQKAVVAGVPVIAAVSAPSSLAVELASRAGLTLVAFVRGRRLCVYAGAERLAPSTQVHAAGSID